jgi:hypothetical protein
MESPTASLPPKELRIDTGRNSTSTLDSADFRALPTKPETMTWSERWEDSKGMALILGAEMFGTGMAASTRLLEMGDDGMTTLQVRSLLVSANSNHRISDCKGVDYFCTILHHVRICQSLSVLYLCS